MSTAELQSVPGKNHYEQAEKGGRAVRAGDSSGYGFTRQVVQFGPRGKTAQDDHLSGEQSAHQGEPRAVAHRAREIEQARSHTEAIFRCVSHDGAVIGGLKQPHPYPKGGDAQYITESGNAGVQGADGQTTANQGQKPKQGDKIGAVSVRKCSGPG